MNDSPLVTIITCTYNRGHLLPRAINSVLQQTYQNYELIIVDDGSTDNTEELVKSYGETRIIYHRHDVNRGIPAALNKGFDLARGDYLCRLDSDDELKPEALKVAVNKIQQLSSQEIKMVWFNDIDAETGNISGSGIDREGLINFEDLLCGRIHGDFWGMMHKDYIGKNRLDERLIQGGWNFWLKRHQEHRGYYVPRVLYKAYRRHGASRSTDYQSLIRNQAAQGILFTEILEEFGDKMKVKCPKYYAKMLAGLGYLKIINSEKKLGRAKIVESFKYKFSLKFLMIYLLSFVIGSNQMLALNILYSKLRNLAYSILASLRKMFPHSIVE